MKCAYCGHVPGMHNLRGSTSGIGAETARHFASLGCYVSLTGRREENLKKVSEECQQKGLPKDKDDLDKIAEPWDGHRIRKNKQEHVVYGKPLVMFELPQLYNTKDFIKPVDQDRVDVCEEEFLFKGNCPCDQDIFNYACLAMHATGRGYPNTPEEAAYLYIDLRRHLRRVIV